MAIIFCQAISCPTRKATPSTAVSPSASFVCSSSSLFAARCAHIMVTLLRIMMAVFSQNCPGNSKEVHPGSALFTRYALVHPPNSIITLTMKSQSANFFGFMLRCCLASSTILISAAMLFPIFSNFIQQISNLHDREVEEEAEHDLQRRFSVTRFHQ